MEYTTIQRYSNCDILIGSNNVEKYGFDSHKTEGEMIDLAVKHRCPVIVKDGPTGKWYLKGQNRSIEYLKHKISMASGKSRDGVFCLLLE